MYRYIAAVDLPGFAFCMSMYSDAGSLHLGLSPWFICTELATCTQHVAHNINHAPGDQRIMLPAVLIPHALTH